MHCKTSISIDSEYGGKEMLYIRREEESESWVEEQKKEGRTDVLSWTDSLHCKNSQYQGMKERTGCNFQLSKEQKGIGCLLRACWMQIPAEALKRAAVTPLWKLASGGKVICELGRTHSTHIKVDLAIF